MPGEVPADNPPLTKGADVPKDNSSPAPTSATMTIGKLSAMADEHLLNWLATDDGAAAKLALCSMVDHKNEAEHLALLLKLGFVHGLRVADQVWKTRLAGKVGR